MQLLETCGYIFLIIILTLCLRIVVVKQSGPTCEILNKGYRQKNDTISILLARISWMNHHRGRINYNARFIGLSIICTFLVCIVIYNGKLPDLTTFIQVTLVLFFCNMAQHRFLTYHSDKFSSYAIDENVNEIRKILSKNSLLKNKEIHTTDRLSKQTKRFSGYHKCFNFVYNQEV